MIPARTKSLLGFRGKTFADFCAVYYATLVSFGNHWRQICSGDEKQLEDLPMSAKQYPAAIRLFRMRHIIERSIISSGLGERVQLGMFSKPWGDLVTRRDNPQYVGFLLDYWFRKFQGEVDLIVAFPYDRRIQHIAYGLSNLNAALGLDETAGVEEVDDQLFSRRFQVRLKVQQQKTIRYISRVHTMDNDIFMPLDYEEYPLSELSFLLHSPSLANLVCSSIILERTELTFEPVCLYESSDEKMFSELNFFDLEILQFSHLEHDTSLPTIQKRVVFRDREGQEYQYIGYFKHAQVLKPNKHFLCLVRRAWSKSDAFLLAHTEVENLAVEELRSIADQNDDRFCNRFDLINLSQLEVQSTDVYQNHFVVGQTLKLAEFGNGRITKIEDKNGVRYLHILLLGKKHKELNTTLIWSETKVFENLNS